MFFEKENVNINKAKSPLLVTHLTDTAKSHFVAELSKENKTPSVVITHSPLRAKELQDDISFFLGRSVSIYPAKDIIFFSADVRSGNITRDRFSVLHSLVDNSNENVVILTIEALYDKLTPKDIFKEFIIDIKLGQEVNIDELTKRLVLMGYERRDQMESEGHFALRGGILDIFVPHGRENSDTGAYRIEFFGDDVDSIRTVDPTTQRSIDKVNILTISPVRELVYDMETLEKAITAIEKDYKKQLDKLKDDQERVDRLREHIGESLEILKTNHTIKNVDNFFAYFYKDNGVSLFNYFSKDTTIYLDEPNKIKAHAEAVFTEFSISNQNRIEQGYILPGQSRMFYAYQDLLHIISDFSNVLMMTLPSVPIGFSPKEIIKIPTREISLVKNNMDNLTEEISYHNENGTSVVVLAGTKSKGERLVKELNERDISINYTSYNSEFLNQNTNNANIVVQGSISRGFEYIDKKTVFISDKEVFSINKKPVRRKRAAKIENFTDLKPGDYIVHDTHGIGVYNGLETMISDNVSRDYLKISYKDDGKIYIPTNQVDRIQKYIGGTNVSLNKLGGVSWERAKTRAKEAVAELAKELAILYAKRNGSRGHEYTKDTVWQTEFEDSFPFEETNDQIIAIEDMKKDMESEKVMDRLICGDVGFGKTEVAIRGAFKAAQDNKQVAFLVPTTILAQQHFRTLKERMQDFPVNIEVLSRFRTKKEQSETIKRIETGACDIVIGTHRLLSKDIKFKDLGLVVVDEEQRFGVSHKEKLKQMTVNVDVLTLSATPIPRTLHMSLSGIRDISLLQDPPTSRKNIQTFVLEYDQEFVKTAVTRELARGGQVYYLYNNTRNIANVAKKISDIVPDARITYAHGQMSEAELERVMMSFIEGEVDVLVCTTIIETGLDIPNANTIIIQDSDHMGLSQLYQLRGRVGRSDRIAYAYLMYKKDKMLNEIATRRLQTIRDFTEFGSGFKVALKDLEIRGVGSLLGSDQSGHMSTIGYEMYSRLLEEAVKELDGEPVAIEREISVDIKISAYIPPTYISNEEQRLFIYKKISHIRNQADFFSVYEEIEDRYGELPKAVDNLMNIALLKGIAQTLGAVEVIQKEQKNNQTSTYTILVIFDPTADVDPAKITEVVGKSKNLLFTVGAAPYITYKAKSNITSQDVIDLKKILESLI